MPIRTTSQIDRVRLARRRLLKAKLEQQDLRTRSSSPSPRRSYSPGSPMPPPMPAGIGGGAPPPTPRGAPNAHLLAIQAAGARRGNKSDASVQMLARVFVQLDTDDSGTLTATELNRALKCLGLKDAGVTVEQVMGSLDADGDREIDVQEWISLLPAEAEAAIKAQLDEQGLIATFKDDGRYRQHGNAHLLAIHAAGSKSMSERQAAIERAQASAEKHCYTTLAALKRELSKAMQVSAISLERTFRGFDANGDGLLDMAELKEGLQILGVSVSQSLVVDMFTLLDKDGGGTVEYVEFARWFGAGPPPAPMTPEVASRQRARDASTVDASAHLLEIQGAGRARYNQSESTLQTMARVFAQLDTDDSGTLSAVEMNRALKCLGLKDAGVTVEQVMGSLDGDGDREIDVKEWVARLPMEAVAMIKSQLDERGLIAGFVDDGRGRKNKHAAGGSSSTSAHDGDSAQLDAMVESMAESMAELQSELLKFSTALLEEGAGERLAGAIGGGGVGMDQCLSQAIFAS